MEYYLAIKRNAFESVLVRWTNLEPRSKSERGRRPKPYSSTYIWNLEKWCWWTYLQARNRDANIENRLAGHSGGRRRGDDLESNTDIYPWTVHGIFQVRIKEWSAFPLLQWIFPPRDQTMLSCIAGRFFTDWAIREAVSTYKVIKYLHYHPTSNSKTQRYSKWFK